MDRFKGKCALVTGAASGIGKATAERLASEGADIVVADINLDGATALAQAIGAANGVRAYPLRFDAADPADCESLVAQAVEKLGKLDILVNNAGIMDWSRADEYPVDRWERVIKINLNAVFFVSKYATPHLLATGGNIVNMSSASSLAGVPFAAAYCAAKAGVNGLTRSMAVEYADRGLRVNAICPGGVDTPLTSSVTSMPEWLDFNKIARLAPKTGKMSAPQEIAGAVAYLASADACNVTGITLSVDGGQVAG